MGEMIKCPICNSKAEIIESKSTESFYVRCTLCKCIWPVKFLQTEVGYERFEDEEDC